MHSSPDQPFFTQPIRQIVLMLIVTFLVATGMWFAFPILEGVFLSSPYLNGLIVAFFFLGVITCVWQMVQLVLSVVWIEDFVQRRPGHEFSKVPSLLAPLAALLGGRGVRLQISSSSARSILDSASTRLDEQRDVTRYLANLLIFLGLLGTFFGLATTVPAVVDTIRALAPQEGQTGIEMFSSLMSGLENQLGGMGTAFSSSLLGLAGSLVIGLLDLFAGHGQNRFYRELEEWLSSFTSLNFGGGDSENGSSDAVLMAVYEKIIDQNNAIATLVVDFQRRLERDTDRASASAEGEREQLQILGEIARGQEQLYAHLAKSDGLRSRTMQEGGQSDAESRMRLRSIDVQLLRILEELAAGREETVVAVRADIAKLTETVAALNPDSSKKG
ncbi:MAG: biopolymer transporter ExbB [Paracoccaceae bacterium]|nr:biopolymer transporter ExbB [Paracoccaceae bacterium]